LSTFVRIWLTPCPLCGRPHLHTSSAVRYQELSFGRGTCRIFISN